MIAFGVKVFFFVLSITGLISSWIVLYAFGRIVGQHWAPMLYNVGNTILQGIFCLGMIYKMDPFLMPRPFCIAYSTLSDSLIIQSAQTIFISVGAYMMSGAAGALSLATSFAVLKPKTWGDGGRSLQWRAIYLYPTVVFPVVATIIQTVFIFKFNSVHPSDDLHCDSTHPEWVRFLSYAGLPFVPGLPSLYLSIRSIRMVYKTHRHIQRSYSDCLDDLSQLGKVSQRTDIVSLSMSQVPADIHSREQIIPAISSLELSSRQFHLPFKDSPLPDSFSAQEIGSDEYNSRTSVSFPTFTKPGIGPGDQPIRWSDSRQADIYADAGLRRPFPDVPRAHIDGSAKTKEWIIDKDSAELALEYSRGDTTMRDSPHSVNVVPRPKSRRPPNLAPAVWRIIIFQVAFVSVEFLTCISTVIDLATHRPTPTPFGTQHIALLLAAWGPVVVFGHLPAVRRNLIPWRELNG